MDDLARQRKDRGFKARRTAVWGVIYQAVYATSQLAALGMLVRYVGKEQYGLWMTVLAVTTWVPLANLGQTSALLTKLGAVSLTDRLSGARIFSTSALLVTITSLVLLLALLLVGPVIPWPELLNAGGLETRPVATTTTVAALAMSVVTVPAVLGSFAIYAHQRGDLVHMVMSAGSILAVGALGLAVWMGQPLWLVGAIFVAGPFLGGAVLWILGLRAALMPRPRWSLVDGSTIRDLLNAGLLFLLIDATALMILRTPDVIVARLHGAEAVGPFASVGRLPLLMLAVFQAVLFPFWPALGEAAHREDHAWVRRIAWRTLGVVLGIWALGATGIGLLGTFFVAVWMGSVEFASPGLIAAACAQSLGLGLLTWMSVLLSALSLQRHLVLTTGVAALVFLPAAFFFGASLGPVGVALAQAGALLFGAVPFGVAALYRSLSQKPLAQVAP